eukprot:CAMPEP_0194757034 /NCGR_PEP_ID=MMETSP0323_2-20130528/10629_1 /TAXON_ID=2866 ORGANISM="Crypthecodinium cohnii, Strain Seligo" /NCGR_SAMPLE_ID=MMETSP0323_2 /ASSEMBLY_ACC=CAM_ASM_000346 /LENGTH=92 /DNA_ID=CAMNT_0039676819 /DNA_START=363 /DNA_END=641 /DNA_ORIENTATION=-
MPTLWFCTDFRSVGQGCRRASPTRFWQGLWRRKTSATAGVARCRGVRPSRSRLSKLARAAKSRRQCSTSPELAATAKGVSREIGSASTVAFA